MHNQALAELIVKLERDCEKAQEASVPQFHIRSEWVGGNWLDCSDLNELNIYFNRRYAEYAITVIGGSGIIDNSNLPGSVVLLVGHMVVTSDLPDVFKQLHDQAPPHLK